MTPAHKSEMPVTAGSSEKKASTEKKSRIPRLTALRGLFHRKPNGEAADDGDDAGVEINDNVKDAPATSQRPQKTANAASKSVTQEGNKSNVSGNNKDFPASGCGGTRARVQISSSGSPSRSNDIQALSSSQISPFPLSASGSRIPLRPNSFASTPHPSVSRNADLGRDGDRRISAQATVTLNRNVIGRANRLATSIMAGARNLPQTDPIKALALTVADSILHSAEYAAMTEAHRIEAEAAAELARLSEKTSIIEVKRVLKTLEGSSLRQFLARLRATGRA